ncbi:MAG: glycosyltransferase [Bdellovibrionales bacterium]
MGIADIVAIAGLLSWLYLVIKPGRFWQPLLFVSPELPRASWPDIDIIVPARNEAKVLPHSLPTWLTQDYPGNFRVMLVDDHSDDGTTATAQKLADELGASGRLSVVPAPDLPAGWSGKVAAMQAGIAQTHAPLILFTDADIAHPPQSLRQLVLRAELRDLALVSQMVKLRCESVAEKLLIPAFVFFFAMLYPFRLANRPDSKVAAAAGGVILARRTALDAIGGLAVIKSELIDDCALAKAIKQKGGGDGKGGRIELTLSNHVRSLRAYPQIEDVWNMVARTAYVQLRRSPWRLAGCVAGMLVMFAAPLLIVLGSGAFSILAGAVIWIVMTLLYLPTVSYYGLEKFWALTLPAAACVYIGATIDSALKTWRGQGGQWKGRTQD